MMSEALKVAKLYFELSNKSDFDGIKKLLTETTTYSSPATGIYLGADNILAMQRAFHGKFESLKWNIKSVEEIKPGIVLSHFEFMGQLPKSEIVETSGLEYIITCQGKIQHFEIRNKTA